MLKIPKWEPADCFIQRKGPAKDPSVAVVRHQLVRLRSGHALCRRCCRSTAKLEGPASAQFLRSACEASFLSQLKTEALIQHEKIAAQIGSDAGQFAM